MLPELDLSRLPEFLLAPIRQLATDPMAARRAMNRVLDDLVHREVEASGQSLACRKGCNWCCHFRVDVHADEVLLIHEYVQRQLAPELRERIALQATEAARKISSMTPEEHLSTNVACAFLVDGGCSVYAVRPSKCRTFHSKEERICSHSYAHPEDDAPLMIGKVEPLMQQASLIDVIYRKAIGSARLDNTTYELNTAYFEAMSSPKALTWLRRGKRVFYRAVRLGERSR